MAESIGPAGDALDQLVQEATTIGRAEAPWLLLRNMHFREGTAHEAFAELQAVAAQHGLQARSEWRVMPNGKRLEWVVFTPRPQR